MHVFQLKKLPAVFIEANETSKFSIFEVIILKQKWRSVTKEIYIVVLTFECSCLKQLEIFWE